jgi:AcrR family transcriptional regulator
MLNRTIMHSPRYSQIPVRLSDLSAYARIRNAALEGFATKGIAATSIRDVAAAAGVSPGLVQHHFGTKAGLRKAVNEYVISLAVEAFRDLAQGDDPSQALAGMGDRVTAYVRDNATALRYLAQALAEEDAEASKLFDALVDIALRNWLQPLAEDGALHPDTDLEWGALHVVVFNLGTVLFEKAINRHLSEPLFSAEQLQRWNAATTDIYRRGLYRPISPKRKRARS